MANMTLADYLRYIHLRLTRWFEETEGKEGDEAVGIEHYEYIAHALHGLQEALEYYQDWQLEDVYEELAWAIPNAQMGARFKSEHALKILPELIDAIEHRDKAPNDR